jgi:hypothetical protein
MSTTTSVQPAPSLHRTQRTAESERDAAQPYRKLLAVIAVVCGIGLMISPFALSLFDRAPAGERIVGRFRTTMSEEGLQELRSNFATIGALADQFVNQTGPGLAQALHMSTAEYNAFVAREFPKVAAGVKEIPPLVAFVSPVAARLEQLHPQFAAVDSLPFLGLSLATVPWILLGIGAGLVGLGLLLAFSAFSLAPVIAALVGAAMIVLTLALSYPAKTRDSRQIADIGNVALSQKAAAGATLANQLINGVVDESQTRLIPVVAARLHLSTEQVQTLLAQKYPAVVAGLQAWPRIRPGAEDLVRRQVASVPDARTLNGIGFRGLPWLMIGPGIALLLGAGLTIGAGYARRA